MKEKIRLAVVGLGGRGTELLRVLLSMKDVEIVALCDLYQDRIDRAMKMAEKKNFSPAASTDYKELLKPENVDAVLVSASWQAHLEVALYAMERGIFATTEVGGTYDVADCWALVDTYERTGTPYMFLENCCYGQREMMCLNMARQGLFGEVVHCNGAYAHDLRYEVSHGKINRHYRLEHYKNHNSENYPSHELGSIAKILGINRGNRMVSLVSVASKSRGLNQYIRDNMSDNEELMNTEFAQGDIVTTVITCENGETIRLTLDTTLPGIYSRDFTIKGTKGMYQEDGDYVFIEGHNKKPIAYLDGNPWKLWRNARKYAKKYDAPLWERKSWGMKNAGHGGMDYLVLRAMVHAAKGETQPTIDAYDGAAWMCITALSAKSIAEGGMPQEIPDFTRGKYKNRTDKATGKYALD